jgi:hypothetical protein
VSFHQCVFNFPIHALGAEVYSTCKPDDAQPDDDQLSYAVFEMQGALLSMRTEWRLCLMACAHPPSISRTPPRSTTEMCGMMFKVCSIIFHA